MTVVDGQWDKNGFVVKNVGTHNHPVTKMCVVCESVWCSTHNKIRRLDTRTHNVEEVTHLTGDNRQVIQWDVQKCGKEGRH